QGIRSDISWGIWTMNPDGTGWAPLVSAFDTVAAANGFHFQTQLSDGSLVVEEYYNQNNSGFGAYIKLPPQQMPYGSPAFHSAHMNSNPAWRYGRVHGIAEPKRLTPLANDGSLSKHLPEGTPFGLVGTSSLYKRESFPNGKVPEGKVTAGYAGGNDPWRGLDAFTSHGNGMPLNFHNQGGDVGLYENSDIHAIRILAMEPTTDRRRGADTGRHFYNHANKRLRIIGE